MYVLNSITFTATPIYSLLFLQHPSSASGGVLPSGFVNEPSSYRDRPTIMRAVLPTLFQ